MVRSFREREFFFFFFFFFFFLFSFFFSSVHLRPIRRCGLRCAFDNQLRSERTVPEILTLGEKLVPLVADVAAAAFYRKDSNLRGGAGLPDTVDTLAFYYF